MTTFYKFVIDHQHKSPNRLYIKTHKIFILIKISSYGYDCSYVSLDKLAMCWVTIDKFCCFDDINCSLIVSEYQLKVQLHNFFLLRYFTWIWSSYVELRNWESLLMFNVTFKLSLLNVTHVCNERIAFWPLYVQQLISFTLWYGKVIMIRYSIILLWWYTNLTARL